MDAITITCLQDFICPDTELGATFRINSITNRNYHIQIIERKWTRNRSRFLFSNLCNFCTSCRSRQHLCVINIFLCFSTEVLSVWNNSAIWLWVRLTVSPSNFTSIVVSPSDVSYMTILSSINHQSLSFNRQFVMHAAKRCLFNQKRDAN